MTPMMPSCTSIRAHVQIKAARVYEDNVAFVKKHNDEVAITKTLLPDAALLLLRCTFCGGSHHHIVLTLRDALGACLPLQADRGLHTFRCGVNHMSDMP